MIIKKISFIILAVFMVLLTACEDNENNMQDQLAGTWQLSSVQKDGQAIDIDGIDNIIQFQTNSIFVRYNTTTEKESRGGWSYEGDMLNISLDLPAAYYIISVNSSELQLKRLDFKDDGELSETVQKYNKVEDSMIP